MHTDTSFECGVMLWAMASWGVDRADDWRTLLLEDMPAVFETLSFLLTSGVLWTAVDSTCLSDGSPGLYWIRAAFSFSAWYTINKKIYNENLHNKQESLVNAKVSVWHLGIQASKTYEVAQNSDKIWTCSSSRSSRVIHLGANRKRTCSFPLVISTNFGRISYCFRDIDAYS